jgi:crotonobetainyl-CoA:carnitine CoA-transferase CaiB-like acyl-CoA transferase
MATRRPLKGVRVIEAGLVLAGPFCGSLLADRGAEVVKVERPDGGDPARLLGPRVGGVPLWWGVAARDKLCVTADLKTPHGKERFLDLIAAADVFVENYRPGVLDRLGLGWEALSACNPGLVMISISGFGQTGPAAGRPGFGKIAEGMSGIVPLTGSPDAIPLHVGFSLADTSAGLMGCMAVTMALLARDRNGGRGARIDVGLYEPLFRMAECQLALCEATGAAPIRRGTNDPYGWGAPGNPERRFVALACADGEILVRVDAAAREALAELLGTGTAEPEQLDASLRGWAGGRPVREAGTALKAAGIEAARIHDGASMAADPYFLARGDVVPVEVPGVGRIAVPGHVPAGAGGRRAFRPAEPGADDEAVFGRPGRQRNESLTTIGSPPMSIARRIGCGAGFAGDRIEPAVALAASGRIDAVVLECLAERTLVPGLRARRTDPEAGADPRLRRRMTPLLPAARQTGCRIISNFGAANPAAAARQIARLADALGCGGLRVAAVVGDDVAHLRDEIAWERPIEGDLLGAHAYLGTSGLVEAIEADADVVVTGRVADSALFAAELAPRLDPGPDAIAAATMIGHLLECSGQVTGGNFEGPGGESLTGRDYADLGYPIAEVMRDGSAEITILEGLPGRVDRLTCTLQLLYEVHDPAAYVTPDVIVDFTGVSIEEVGPNRVRVSGARAAGRPTHLKVSGFVERPGAVADVEIAFAGTLAYERALRAAEALRIRLESYGEENLRIDLVGVDSVLGGASRSLNAMPPEVRVHVSARCDDPEMAQAVEDEVYTLTICGPAGGGSVRSERRPRLEVLDGYIPREKVPAWVEWGRP